MDDLGPIRIAVQPAASTAWPDRVLLLPAVEVVECRGAAACLELATRGGIDALILDWDEDTAAATDLARQLGVCGGLPVLASTASLDPAERAAVLDAGAAVLITPAIADLELVAQLRAARRLVRPTARNPLRFHASTMEVEQHGERTALTETQWKLLVVLSSRPGRYFSAAELMTRIWGYTTGPTSTVSVHLHRLRVKLERDPTHPTLIQTERGRGYALVPDEGNASA